MSQPTLLFEVKVELQDARSGYRNSYGGVFQGPLLADEELDWPSDLVHPVDPDLLEETTPPWLLAWPQLADQKIIRCMVAYYRPRIWRNRTLGVFSRARESEADFVLRCRDMLRERWAQELKKVRELFFHRFMELEQRLREVTEREEFDDVWRAHRLAKIQDLFGRVRESLSRWFMREDCRSLDPTDTSWQGEIPVEYQEKLDLLRREFILKYNEVSCLYESQAAEIEPYEVPLTYPQIEIVSRRFLWD